MRDISFKGDISLFASNQNKAKYSSGHKNNRKNNKNNNNNNEKKKIITITKQEYQQCHQLRVKNCKSFKKGSTKRSRNKGAIRIKNKTISYRFCSKISGIKSSSEE